VSHAYAVADVFTDAPLEGNQVAVFLDAADLTDAEMQRTAREMNLSETVFVLPGDADADAAVRIFTPTAELPFAGHPVLGTAFILAAERAEAVAIRLRTKAGVIALELTRRDGEVTFAEMRQPLPTVAPFAEPEALLAALGTTRAVLPIESYDNGPVHVMVALPDEAAVAAIVPDLNALGRLGTMGVSCFAGAGTRFKTRMFAPALGVPEDPATGSAAGPLAIHLVRHGVIAPGTTIDIRQGAEIARPSLLRARPEGTRERIDAVFVGGAAVVVARGDYRLT
jgi:trans-2,3-dihydro-3-hydroxyanthranilate isomerase